MDINLSKNLTLEEIEEGYRKYQNYLAKQRETQKKYLENGGNEVKKRYAENNKEMGAACRKRYYEKKKALKKQQEQK